MKKILFLLLLITSHAFAWDSTGHRLIAQIAYDNLTPAAREKVDQITVTLDGKYPPPSRFLFAAVWPDALKHDDVTAFNSWHFINNPFSADGTPLEYPHTQNIVWAIAQAEQVIRSPNANPYEKTLFFRFLVHLVGDAHQPLHTAERFSQQHKHGDGSGNLFLIQDQYEQNLHGYWDAGLNWFRQYGEHYPLSGKEVRKLAGKIEQDYPKTFFGDKVNDTDPQHWTQQSFQIAKDFVYNLPENSKPSAEYQQQGQKIAEQQIALAGYRLANLLNKILA